MESAPELEKAYSFYKDKTHYDILSEETVAVEEEDKEYESLRSYFAYKKLASKSDSINRNSRKSLSFRVFQVCEFFYRYVTCFC